MGSTVDVIGVDFGIIRYVIGMFCRVRRRMRGLVPLVASRRRGARLIDAVWIAICLALQGAILRCGRGCRTVATIDRLAGWI